MFVSGEFKIDCAHLCRPYICHYRLILTFAVISFPLILPVQEQNLFVRA